MRAIDADALEEKLDKIPARKIENADGRAYVLIRLSTVFEIIKQMPSAQPETVRCKDCKWKNQHNCTRAVELFIDDDKYCSWAERRTDG